MESHSLMQFKDKVIIITGGGTGIGAAAALMLARAGARIVVNYASSEDAARTTAAACSAEGPEAIAMQANVADTNWGFILPSDQVPPMPDLPEPPAE